MAADYFDSTAGTDLDEPTAGSAGGVRIAAQGALWQVAIFGFAGLFFEDKAIALNPRLPPKWAGMAFRVQWRGRRIHLRLTQATRMLAATLELGDPMSLRVNGQTLELQRGKTLQASW